MDFSLLSHSPFSLALYTRVVDREAERTKDGARKLAGGVTDGRGREGGIGGSQERFLRCHGEVIVARACNNIAYGDDAHGGRILRRRQL